MNWNHRLCSKGGMTARGRRGGLTLAAAVLLLDACTLAEASAVSSPPAGVPAAAIEVAPDLYMLPMGIDEAGCPVFQPWSPTMMVVQVLHWRTADGSFTLDRDAADCPPPAGETPDGRGAPDNG